MSLSRTCKNTKTLLEKPDLRQKLAGYYYRNEIETLTNSKRRKVQRVMFVPLKLMRQSTFLRRRKAKLISLMYPISCSDSYYLHPLSRIPLIYLAKSTKNKNTDQKKPRLLPTSLITAHKIYSQYLSYPSPQTNVQILYVYVCIYAAKNLCKILRKFTQRHITSSLNLIIRCCKIKSLP